MNIHAIQKVDLSECADLFVNVFNNPPWDESWEKEVVTIRLHDCFRTPGFFGLLVRDDEDLIGFALGYSEQWDKGRHFYLVEMCVASERQNLGIGTALIEALQEGLRAQGIRKIDLLTARESVAQSFYEKRGFNMSSKMVMMSKWLG